MKIDPIIVRRLREERAWSQDHLASAAGVSLRTVQRVESEGTVSAETRLSLAAAFGIEVVLLAGRSPAAAAPAAADASSCDAGADSGPGAATAGSDAMAAPAPGWVAHLRRTGFLRHASIYVAVITSLAWFDLRAQDGVMWFQWPLLGWGAGIASHGFRSWRSGRPNALGRERD